MLAPLYTFSACLSCRIMELFYRGRMYSVLCANLFHEEQQKKPYAANLRHAAHTRAVYPIQRSSPRVFKNESKSLSASVRGSMRCSTSSTRAASVSAVSSGIICCRSLRPQQHNHRNRKTGISPMSVSGSACHAKTAWQHLSAAAAQSELFCRCKTLFHPRRHYNIPLGIHKQRLRHLFRQSL